MTDYPSIKPEDVREGDVVRARFDAAQWPATIEGVVHYSLTNVEDYRLYVGGYVVSGAADLRLVSRPTPPEPLCPFSMGETVYVKGAPKPLTVAGWNYYAAWGKWMVRCEDGAGGYRLHLPMELTSSPPEPPLRVGDFVQHPAGIEGQVTSINAGITLIRYNNGTRGGTLHVCARVEPPVGWPVGVPTIDAPTVWYFKSTSRGTYVWCGDVEIDFSWAELVAAGGVPALAVTR